MKKTLHRVFWLWEFEKEKKWLNEMSANGWQLRDVGFCEYIFELTTPGEYQYQMELLDNWPSHKKSVEYIQFLEDTGVEYVGSVMRWVYLRKKAGTDGFDLFSDIDSRIKHLDRMLLLAGVLGIAISLNTINLVLSYHQQDIVAVICATVSLVLIYAFARLYLMRSRLKKESFFCE